MDAAALHAALEEGAARPQLDASHCAPPKDALEQKVREGTPVPDEAAGPYALGSFHANITGRHRGYKEKAGFDAWEQRNQRIMARQQSWGSIDFEGKDPLDPDWMFAYGSIGGKGVVMAELRPVVVRAQAAMRTTYAQRFVRAGMGAAFRKWETCYGASAARAKARLRGIGLRMSRRAEVLTFEAWRTYVCEARGYLRVALARWANGELDAALCTWRAHAAEASAVRTALRRALGRLTASTLCKVYGAWARHAAAAGHERGARLCERPRRAPPRNALRCVGAPRRRRRRAP